MKYKFSNDARVIINGNKVVLANVKTGQWAKISKESYDVLMIGINNKISFEELKLLLHEDDKNYVENIYKELYYLQIIDNSQDSQLIRNKIVSFEITHRCNLKCIHCCIDADGVTSSKQDLSTEEIKSILDKIVEWNPERIMLSGGEPMLRNDFIEILTYLNRIYDGNIIISTNGMFINHSNVSILSKCADQIDISIDGVDEESCSIIRGPGVFDKVINNLKILQETGFERISLSLAIGDKNQHIEDRFIELNKQLNTKPLIRNFTPIGRGLKNNSILSSKKLTDSGVSDKYLSDSYTGGEKVCNCTGGTREVFIGYNGDIYPCPSLIKEEYKLGNIIKLNSLNDLKLSKSEILDNLNPQNYTNCSECKVNLFCWPCPGEFERLKYNEEALSDRCNKIKPVLYKRIWGEL